MDIRFATMNDIDAVTELERRCFPPEEAAEKDSFEKLPDRIPESFLVTGGFRETGKHDQWNDDRYSNPAG